MTSKVLLDGPSDHDPFVQTFEFLEGHGRFTAVTYNVEHSNNARTLSKFFHRIADLVPDVWLLQEVKPHKGIEDLLQSMGFACRRVQPEFCIAWSEAVWTYVSSRRVQMSPIHYWTVNYAFIVVLEHRATGKRVRFMTYHPPAHVQGKSFKGWRKVFAVLKDAVAKWNRIAKSDGQDIVANCFAGDDNVDEHKGWHPKGGWEFMLHGPLKQITAPHGTHGGRKIDDFRVSGIRPVD